MDNPETLEDALKELARVRVERDKLAEKLGEAEHLRADFQEFVYIASHDMQAPLRKLSAFNDRIQELAAGKLDDKAQHYMNRMHVAVVRMQSMLDGLLALSRVVTREIKPEAVSLGTTIEAARQEIESDPGYDRVTFDVDVQGCSVRADAPQFRQLLVELLRNAVRYCHAADNPRITVRAQVLDGRQLEICIADNGIGFESSHSDVMFAMFQRLHVPDPDEPRCGAGLAICKRIVEINGGSIRAEGVPDEGARMIMVLPGA